MRDHIELRESDIRPHEAYTQWYSLVQQDIPAVFASAQTSHTCVGCGATQTHHVFDVFGLPYHACFECGSIFSIQRPAEGALNTFYSDSPSQSFWKEHILEKTKEQRLTVYWRPLTQWVEQLIKRHRPETEHIVEYKPKFFTPFSVEKYKMVEYVEPFHISSNHASVVSLEQLNNPVDVFAAFDVMDREVDPRCMIQQMSEKSTPGSLLFLTTNTASGLEYQVLGQYSKRLVPPDRLNLVSLEAIERMLKENGYDIIEMSTPSVLDVEIISQAFQEDPTIPVPAFIKYILQHRNESTWKSLQNFLQLNNLGSFARVAAIKK